MRPDRLTLCSALIGFTLFAGCGESSRFGTLPDAGVSGPEFSFLPAGLDVESAPPPGWTDLVVKLVPDLSVTGGPGVSAEDSVGSSFRYVLLADVTKPQRSGGDYTLRAVGVGLSLPINGKDTVITMGTREQQGVALTKVTKFALYALEDDMHQSTLLAGTGTFALIGTRTRLKVGGTYRKIQLRYAVAVDPKTGALSRAVWPVDGEKAGPSFVELAGGTTIHVPFTVVLVRAAGVVPKGVMFGMTELPKGRTLPLPAALATPALPTNERYSPERSAELEKAFRLAVSVPTSMASSQ
jgi:hypothetical protein